MNLSMRSCQCRYCCGSKVAKKCAACHTFDEGGANKVGPALYGIVNKGMGATDGFGYSAALKAYGEGKTWTYEELNGFLWKPKTYIKGTGMGFPGLKKLLTGQTLLPIFAACPQILLRFLRNKDLTITNSKGQL